MTVKGVAGKQKRKNVGTRNDVHKEKVIERQASDTHLKQRIILNLML